MFSSNCPRPHGRVALSRSATTPAAVTFDALEPRQLFSFSQAGPPQPPTDITATADGRLPVIRVTWKDNSGKEAGYTLERKRGRSGSWLTLATLPANATYYRNTGLEAGTSYSYRVAAFNRAGASLFVGPAGVITEGGVALAPNPAPALGRGVVDARQADVRVIDGVLTPGGDRYDLPTTP